MPIGENLAKSTEELSGVMESVGKKFTDMEHKMDVMADQMKQMNSSIQKLTNVMEKSMNRLNKNLEIFGSILRISDTAKNVSGFIQRLIPKKNDN